MIPNIVTFDIEEWFQVYNLWEAIPRETWTNREQRLNRQIEEICDLLDEFQIKATCFVLGWVARHNPGIVQLLAERGHEIACHGLNHDLIFAMSKEQFRQETITSTELLEDLTGFKVRGYRASNFSITLQNLWALELLSELGYEYDSSIFPINRNRYGIATFPRQPVHMHLPDSSNLIEFPLATYRFMGRNLPSAGGGYFRFFPLSYTRLAINQLNSKEIPAVIYLHPWEFDPGQPRITTGSRLKRFMHYCNLDLTNYRLRKILPSTSFLTMGEFTDHYREIFPVFDFPIV